MALVLTAASAAEPISLAEAKAHLRIDTNDEDALLTSLIAAARFVDFWPSAGCITLPIPPVKAVSAMKVHDWLAGWSRSMRRAMPLMRCRSRRGSC